MPRDTKPAHQGPSIVPGIADTPKTDLHNRIMNKARRERLPILIATLQKRISGGYDMRNNLSPIFPMWF